MRARIGDIEMTYELEGPAQAPVVMLSHSLATTLEMWKPQLPALTKDYRVLRYDMRGHGGGSAPGGAYSFPMLARDVVALLDHLKIERVAFVGLSIGGMIGQYLAIHHADRLRCVALCSTTSAIPEAGRAMWDQRIAAVESGGMAPQVESTLERWFTAPYRAAHPEIMAWVGGMNVTQVTQLLDVGERELEASLDPLLRRLVAADGLHGAGDNVAAASAYAALLEEAPPGWGERVRVLESLALALALSGQNEAAARLAMDHLETVRRRPAALTLVTVGLDGALQLPDDHPQRAAWAAALERAGLEIVKDSTLDVSADDRSGLYGSLVSARESAQDEEGRLRAAREWAAFLEREAARASSPHQRTVFDSHRLSVYIELGEPERALPMLEASERDFPEDYNPPARLALTYLRMKRWEDALSASDRALAAQHAAHIREGEQAEQQRDRVHSRLGARASPSSNPAAQRAPSALASSAERSSSPPSVAAMR